MTTDDVAPPAIPASRRRLLVGLNYATLILSLVLAGVFLGLILTAIAAAIWAVAGSEAMSAKYGPPLLLARKYVQGGVLGGLIVGVLSPLARWRAGVFVLGWLAAAALYATVATTRLGPLKTWGWFDYIGITVMATVLGSAGAVRFLRDTGRWNRRP